MSQKEHFLSTAQTQDLKHEHGVTAVFGSASFDTFPAAEIPSLCLGTASPLPAPPSVSGTRTGNGRCGRAPSDRIACVLLRMHIRCGIHTGNDPSGMPRERTHVWKPSRATRTTQVMHSRAHTVPRGSCDSLGCHPSPSLVCRPRRIKWMTRCFFVHALLCNTSKDNT